MQEDFFAELGETLSRTAKDISSRADSFFESQKIRTKILAEQRMIDKSLADIGNIIYKKYVEGGAVDEDIAQLCEDITQRKITITEYRETVSKMKGQKTCASCGAEVPEEASFCMQCGAPVQAEDVPGEEPEEEPVEQAPVEEPPVGEAPAEEEKSEE